MSPDLKDLFDQAGRSPAAAPSWNADRVVALGARARRRRLLLTSGATVVATAAVVAGGAALLGPLHLGGMVAPPLAGGTTPSPVATTTPSLESPSSTPTSEPGTGSATPSPTPTGRACTASDVTLSLGMPDGAAGTTYYPVMVKAVPGVVCDVGGFPFVDVPVAVGAIRAAVDGEATAYVSVQGASVASFTVAISNSANYDPAVCRSEPVTSLNATLPGDTAEIPVALPSGTTVCAGDVSSVGHQVHVRPIVAGPDGQ